MLRHVYANLYVGPAKDLVMGRCYSSAVRREPMLTQAQKYWKIKCKVPMYLVNYKNLVKIQLNHKKHNNRTEASDNVLMVRHFYA